MGERLSIEEIRRRYDGEWVLVDKPESNEEQGVLSGVVAAHSKDRDEVYDAMLKHPSRHMATLCLKVLPEGWTLAL